jgi:hypothetical protein
MAPWKAKYDNNYYPVEIPGGNTARLWNRDSPVKEYAWLIRYTDLTILHFPINLPTS